MPKTASVKLPTVISTSVILNAVVRGAEAASTQLGDGYYSVVRKDIFRNTVSVFKDSVPSSTDPLDTAQSVADSETPIWSMELTDHTLDDKRWIFKNPPKYFFLSKEDASAYLKKIEEDTVKLILKSAANALKESK